MNTILDAKLVTDRDSKSDGTEAVDRSGITDFFEARHEMFLEGQETVNSEQGIRQGQDAALRYEPFGKRVKIIEQGMYWLISAPALAYLIHLAFGV